MKGKPNIGTLYALEMALVKFSMLI